MLVVLASVLLTCVFRPRYFSAAMKIIGVCGLGAVAAGSFVVFRQGMEIFAYRFGDTANVKVGFIDRFFSSFLAPFDLFGVVDFYGVGLGMGTNVAAGILFEGQRKFLYAEGELGRVMFESGQVMGPIYVLLRVAIALFLFGQALRTLRRGDGHPLPMLLLGACGIDMVLGQFGQATTLGYVTMACGLCLAANRPGAPVETEAALPPTQPRAKPLPPLPGSPRASALPGSGLIQPETPTVSPARPSAGTAPRGRSAYAEQMHREAEEESRRQKAEGRSSETEDKPSE